MLINDLCGMKRKARGPREPRHIQKYIEVASAAQHSCPYTRAINQRLSEYTSMFRCKFHNEHPDSATIKKYTF